MRTSDRYEKQLTAAGLRTSDIDFVMCTHLHVDHVGWNTRLENGRWVPTFPRAKYLFSERELAYWTEKHNSDPAKLPWITDSVLPIVEAGRAEPVKSDHALTDLVELVPSPGHTIDHFCVRIGTPGEDAIITGDMVHSPVQIRYPEIGMFNDYSSSQAEETRRRLFDELSESATLLCSAHFPSPSSGRIVRRGTTFDYEPLPG
jgi:glyoxylase-like metal-dependent hydrolase (beta-lactamase superfamily II)